MALTTSVDDRDRLIQLVNNKQVLIDPEARRLIMRALEDSKTVAPPLMKPTDYELIAYIDEVQELTAKVDCWTKGMANARQDLQVQAFLA